ncbi:MAG: YciI family protein [Bacteroidota bacterium]
MKKFLILHFGFEMPTPEDMAGWNSWFASIADRQVERGHLPGGNEISGEGMTPLPFGKDSLTGYTMIKAASLDEATEIAQACPFVISTRVYEVKG